MLNSALYQSYRVVPAVVPVKSPTSTHFIDAAPMPLGDISLPRFWKPTRYVSSRYEKAMADVVLAARTRVR
jgi:hypothetical protein